MAKTKVTKIAFNDKGNLIDYLTRTDISQGYVGYDSRRQIYWRDNVPFAAELELIGHQRGRSSAIFEWKDSEGHSYPMFMTDMTGLLMSGVPILFGRTPAVTWMIAKRGQNYGIRLATSEDFGYV